METLVPVESYSPSSSLTLEYTDAVSSVFPDRPIRPLPKRRLRARLSSEDADSILKATSSAPSEKLFRIPFLISENSGQREALRASPQAPAFATARDDHDFAGSKDTITNRDSSPLLSQRLPFPQNLDPQNDLLMPRNDGADLAPNAVLHSTASSVDSIDGYDSFENTNNKKKRKVPANGAPHSSLSADMASLGIASARDLDMSLEDSDIGLGHYYGSGSSALPAKPGNLANTALKARSLRSNLRTRKPRSPLGASWNGSNRAWPLKTDVHEHSVEGNGSKSTRKFDAKPPRASPIQRESKSGISTNRESTIRTPQFTFTCESEASDSVIWPETGLRDQAHTVPDSKSPGMLRDDRRGSQINSHARGVDGILPTDHSQRRRFPLLKQYAMAAKDRRLRQTYSNFHHPPKEEDVWICEYCEYEAMFGRPPEALIRQYEVKDRRERRRLAEKRRLLEKAKMKGKKGKKGAKASKALSPPNPDQTDSNEPQESGKIDEQASAGSGSATHEFCGELDCLAAPERNSPRPQVSGELATASPHPSLTAGLIGGEEGN